MLLLALWYAWAVVTHTARLYGYPSANAGRGCGPIAPRGTGASAFMRRNT